MIQLYNLVYYTVYDSAMQFYLSIHVAYQVWHVLHRSLVKEFQCYLYRRCSIGVMQDYESVKEVLSHNQKICYFIIQ